MASDQEERNKVFGMPRGVDPSARQDEEPQRVLGVPVDWYGPVDRDLLRSLRRPIKAYKHWLLRRSGRDPAGAAFRRPRAQPAREHSRHGLWRPLKLYVHEDGRTAPRSDSATRARRRTMPPTCLSLALPRRWSGPATPMAAIA